MPKKVVPNQEKSVTVLGTFFILFLLFIRNGYWLQYSEQTNWSEPFHVLRVLTGRIDLSYCRCLSGWSADYKLSCWLLQLP